MYKSLNIKQFLSLATLSAVFYTMALPAVPVVGTNTAGQDVPDDAFAWRTDLDAARQEARETGRPLLVVFR